jgi:hypothetical protein
VRTELRAALIRDLQRLAAEIPELIAHVEAGNELKTQEALALLTKGSSGRFDFLMNRLTDHVVDEAMKGNCEPLRLVTSGRFWA